MKLLLVSFVLGLFLPISMVAQCSNEWVRQISGLPNGNLANNQPSIIIDPNDNVIVSNGIYSTESLIVSGQQFPEADASGQDTDFFVAKYDSEGGLLWSKVVNGVGIAISQDLQTDNDGNIYLSGLMTNSISIDGVVYDRSGATWLGFLIIKFSPSGDLIWLRKGDYNGSRCYSICWTGSELAFVIPYSDSVSIDGQVFYSDDELWYQDMVFGKLDADGNLINAVNIGGDGNVEVNSFDCDAGGCILQGRFDRELSYDGTTVSTPAENHFELYQMSIDTNYNLDWLNHSQSSPAIDPRAYGLSLSADGAIYFSGFYWNSGFTIAGQQLPAPLQNDVFVGQLNRLDGSIVWLKNGGGSSFDATKCLATSAGSVWTGGEFYSDVFNYEGSSLTNTTDGENDGFLFSLDSEGKPKCGLQLEGVGQNGILQVEGFGDDQVAILVYFNGTVEFGGQTYSAQGNYDLLVIKTCLPCDTGVGIEETVVDLGDLTIYPNPATTQTQLTYHTPQGAKPTLLLTDMLGRVVHTAQPAGNKGTYTLDVSTLGAGVYFCTLLNGTEVLVTQKLSVIDNE